ncbi:MAG: hypothetical protein M0041_05055, partial [Nitrospiraceae bacterium]|nr:hypothetical protein [Nitrospiraceae bacterium]
IHGRRNIWGFILEPGLKPGPLFMDVKKVVSRLGFDPSTLALKVCLSHLVLFTLSLHCLVISRNLSSS